MNESPLKMTGIMENFLTTSKPGASASDPLPSHSILNINNNSLANRCSISTNSIPGNDNVNGIILKSSTVKSVGSRHSTGKGCGLCLDGAQEEENDFSFRFLMRRGCRDIFILLVLLLFILVPLLIMFRSEYSTTGKENINNQHRNEVNKTAHLENDAAAQKNNNPLPIGIIPDSVNASCNTNSIENQRISSPPDNNPLADLIYILNNNNNNNRNVDENVSRIRTFSRINLTNITHFTLKNFVAMEWDPTGKGTFPARKHLRRRRKRPTKSSLLLEAGTPYEELDESSTGERRYKKRVFACPFIELQNDYPCCADDSPDCKELDRAKTRYGIPVPHLNDQPDKYHNCDDNTLKTENLDQCTTGLRGRKRKR